MRSPLIETSLNALRARRPSASCLVSWALASNWITVICTLCMFICFRSIWNGSLSLSTLNYLDIFFSFLPSRHFLPSTLSVITRLLVIKRLLLSRSLASFLEPMRNSLQNAVDTHRAGHRWRKKKKNVIKPLTRSEQTKWCITMKIHV